MSGPQWPGEEIGGGTPAPSGGVRPVFTAPADPLVEAQKQAGIVSSQSGVADTAHDNAQSDKTVGIQNAQTLRKEFYSLPQVTTYGTVIQSTAAALRAEPTATGDQQLITAYAKALDPNSVVREGEFNTVANGDSAVGRLWAKLQKEGGIDGAGMVRPEVRDRLKRGLINLAKGANEAYNSQRVYFKSLAEHNGITPDDVIGPHLGSPYLSTLEDYDKQHNPGQANSPEMRGGFAAGTQVEMGADKPSPGPFDRDTYLKQQFGVTPDQEALIVGFWNANRGNQALTPAAVADWYQKNGLTPPANMAQGIESAKKGLGFSGFDTTGAEKAYRDRLQQGLDKQGFDPNSIDGLGNKIGMGASQGFADELTGVGQGIDALVNNRPVIDAYREGRDQTRLAYEQSGKALPVIGTIGEIAGGALTAAPLAGEATLAGGVRAGATAGSFAGYGYGEGVGGSLGGAALGGLTGAGLGYVGGKTAEALTARAANRATQPLTEGGQVVAAADRLNQRFGTEIKPIPADVSGAGVRNATGGTAKLPLGAASIVNAAGRVSTEAQVARDAIAKIAGNPTELETSGEAALKGAQNYIKNSKTKVNALYARARSKGGNEPVDLVNARQALDDQIAELSQVPGGAPGLEKLQTLRTQLDKPYPVEGVRGMRTNLRDQFASDGLRGSDIERRVGLVADAAEDDIISSLQAAGKSDAAAAYKAAATAHRERVETIDNIIAPIIGPKGSDPKSGEQIMEAISSATQRNNARLGRFLNSIPADDSATVRATLISGLGKASKGTQNAAGDAFSLPQFLTHWNGMTPAAKRTLFGPELRASLDDLAKVAQGTKEAQRFANFSNTGSPVGLVATGGLLTQFVAAPVTTTALVAGQYGLGRLLASPTFARWLAKMPANPAAARSHITALSRIAANDTAIATDALGLQRQLMERFSDMPGKLAAQPTSGQTGQSSPTTVRVPQ